MKKKTRYIIIIGLVVIFGALVAWYKFSPGQYDSFANCLKTKQVKFYGAFWCPHCQATKRAFGKSAELLPYVECSTPDGNGQDQTCSDAHITGYPTWEFPTPLTLAASAADTSIACKAPYTSDQPQACEGTADGSWITVIGGLPYVTPSKPTQAGGNWNLPAHTRLSGEVPGVVSMQLLSQLSTCPIK